MLYSFYFFIFYIYCKIFSKIRFYKTVNKHEYFFTGSKKYGIIAQSVVQLTH